MATLHSVKQKNKLEFYLDDVYEKECKFKIEQEEIDFIQTGIETLVQELVEQVLVHDSFDKHVSDAIDHTSKTTDLYYLKNLVEVYFPIQSDCSLQRYVAENASHINITNCTIIKVGSFYDGTKNNFPDEFDFIFPLLGIRTNGNIPQISYEIQQSVLEAIPKRGKSLCYPPKSKRHQETRKLYFKTSVGEHGPACKIKFKYRNGFAETRFIYVDLVPAIKIMDTDTEEWFWEKVSIYVEPKTFREEILSARNSLAVYWKLAFTEIEQNFMTNILSKKHVKVQRILKYLLNGNGDGEKLQDYLIKEQREEQKKEMNVMQMGELEYRAIHTSYCIKILMIYHHESCTDTGTEDLGPCVLQVLKEMSKYQSRDKFPSFTRPFRFKGMFCVLSDLEYTIGILQSMKTSQRVTSMKEIK